jgi:hypothetical protein
MNHLRHVRTVALLLGLIAGVSIKPVFARDWIDAPVITAAERVFTAMPDDYFQVRPAATYQEIATGKL